MSVQPTESAGGARELAPLGPAELDALPIGAILLDDAGVVRAYNRERGATSVAGSDILGRNFFSEVAPFAREFFGRFRAGLERKSLNEAIDVTFRTPQGVREVRIRMVYTAVPPSSVWVFVTPLA